MSITLKNRTPLASRTRGKKKACQNVVALPRALPHSSWAITPDRLDSTTDASVVRRRPVNFELAALFGEGLSV